MNSRQRTNQSKTTMTLREDNIPIKANDMRGRLTAEVVKEGGTYRSPRKTIRSNDDQEEGK